MHALIWILTGITAGALARLAMRERSMGLTGHFVLGALGSVCGSWLLRLVSGRVEPGSLANVLTAFVGAVVLVAAVRLVVRGWHGVSRTAIHPPVEQILGGIESRMKQLTEIERTVLYRVLMPLDRTRSADEPLGRRLTFGERTADRVATFGGSWTFLGCFAAFMLAWMFVNTAAARPADPYPFILLNLVLSCLAAVQAPVIMMSQNRQAARDRFDAQQDYQVNVRAEMQITALHQKLDHTRDADLQELLALQREQMAILRRLMTTARRDD